MAALGLLALGFAAGANAAPQLKLPVASPVLNVAVAPLAPAILPPLSLGATTQLGVSQVFTASLGGGIVVNNPLTRISIPSITPPAAPTPAVPSGALPTPAIPSGTPPLPIPNGIPPLPIPGVPAVPGVVPAVVGAAAPVVGALAGGAVPVVGNTLNSLALPGGIVPDLGGGIPSVPSIPLPGPGSVPPSKSFPASPTLPTPDTDPVYQAVCKVGASVVNLILAAMTRVPGVVSSILPSVENPIPSLPNVGSVVSNVGSVVPSLPVVPNVGSLPAVGSVVPNLGSLPSVGSVVPGAGSLPIKKRQLLPALTTPKPSPSPSPSPAAGTSGGALGGLTGGLLGGSSSPLGAVSGVTSGGLTGGLTGGASPLGSVPSTVTGATSGLTGGSSPLGAVTGSSGPLGAVTGATAPLSGAVSGALGTVSQTTSGLPLVGGVANNVVGGVTSTVGQAVPNLSPYYALNGIKGTDPVGGLGVGIIATLLSLLKKDPMSLFAPSLPIPALAKRDIPDLAERTAEFEVPELQKRQLGLPLPGAGSIVPSLSQGIPGIGIGSLVGSGIPGVSPDVAALVGAIGKNIAIPGGNGLGSVTGSILSVLNGIIPNFVFQLPVVQDSVPTFSVLQLLASINPAKFKDLGSLTTLPALQQAAASIPAADLAFIKTLPSSPDPSNLITTITSYTDNVLTLPGNVGNLKASVAALSMKSLGLNVPGLS